MIRTPINHSNVYLFLSAARTLSFTKTGEIFGITQGAVSHRIKSLEEEVGCKLFVRRPRNIALTPEGSLLFSSVSQSFELVDNVISDLKNPNPTGELRIGASPSFASQVLIPNLPKFLSKYPDLDVRIITSRESKRFDDESMDLAIVYDEAIANLHSEAIVRESIIPVCSHEYAHKNNLLNGRSTIEGLTLIDNVTSTNWKQWSSQECYEIKDNRTIKVDDFHSSTSAAISGVGIAIARWILVKDLLKSGALVSPFNAILTDKHYWLVTVKGMEHRPKYRLFSNWICEEIFGKKP
ncbi:LysR family transcriptional regulator [Vibrio sp. ZSDE26]|uniref:LysR family transcriptional regulator n=1 Tax=Vibrio amylolyticus TaxID=2847292 RepID=A0A9X1XK94_9VIBR|nr:LysR substrate-binding domain-containing protein [Vibrio amylolyticus]MCK6264482.1 LysR family transcriptional regulator [Vibrio amylolyticus]